MLNSAQNAPYDQLGGDHQIRVLPGQRKAPFYRLGGGDVIERAVTTLFAHFKATPDLIHFLPDSNSAGYTAEVEWNVQLWLTDILGGPMTYNGPNVAALFGKPNVAPDIWARLDGLIAEALQDAGAPSPAVDETRELLGAALGLSPRKSDTVFPSAWRDESDSPIAFHDEAVAVHLSDTELSTPMSTGNHPGLAVTASNLRQEARAIEESARALLGLTEVLDTLADRATGHGADAPVESIASAVADADGAARMVEHGLAVLGAAREVADGPGRSREVSAALGHLMDLARRTNQLVLDASLRAVEDEVCGAATELMTRTGALRMVLAAQVTGLAEEAQGVSRKLEHGAITAGRFAELREAMRDPSAI